MMDLPRLFSFACSAWAIRSRAAATTACRIKRCEASRMLSRWRFHFSRSINRRGNLPRQTGAEPLQIVLPVGFMLDRHLACDPVKRDIGLRPAQFRQPSSPRPENGASFS